MGAVEDILFFASVFREFGVPVEFEDGWERRGNGSTANYQGGIVHHTAIPASYANPGPGTRVLRDGRPDLSGPLCEWQGKFNGAVRCIAAHPANHAGASGGPGMGPLPVSRLFNPLVQGMEIDYSGDGPMSPEQYRAALVFAIACKRRYGSIERCRAHMETSIEGKWDPGYAPGRTIDMTKFRRDALALEASGGTILQEEDMPLTQDDGNVVWAARDPYIAGRVEKHPVADWMGLAAIHAAYNGRKLDALTATVGAIASAVSDGDLDADAVLQRVDTAVQQATERAITSSVLPALRAVVEDVLGDDNADQAEEIVRRLGERLTRTEAA